MLDAIVALKERHDTHAGTSTEKVFSIKSLAMVSIVITVP
jgi:hypothetical protein